MDADPVVVGVDGSSDSKRALAWAAECARKFGAPLHALTTWDIPPLYGYPMGFDAEEQASFESHASDMLAEVIGEVLLEGTEVVKRVTRGHPAVSLVNASESAQLLVVGTRGHGAFVGMVMGSVSRHCVLHSRCPVVVVPEVESKEK